MIIEVATWRSNAYSTTTMLNAEIPTGYRAFSRDLLERLPLEANSDDFVFDNQVLAQVIALSCAIGELT